MTNIEKALGKCNAELQAITCGFKMNLVYKKSINGKKSLKDVSHTLNWVLGLVSAPDWFIGLLPHCQKFKKNFE